MPVYELKHPLIQHKLTFLRDKSTEPKEFRELTNEISTLMAYEITRDLATVEVNVETPLTSTTGRIIKGKKLAVVPILRAGLGMLDGVLKIIPKAKVGHIGIYRDPESLKPVDYYWKIPQDSEEREIIVVDPMLATGGSAHAAINFLKEKNIKNIKLMCIIAAPEGINYVLKDHPEIDIYTATIDEKLNSHGYILPGLGDAGDRLYGTK